MKAKIFLLIIMIITNLPAYGKSTKSLRWKILNDSWDERFELSYQNFIHTLGSARKNGYCRTTDGCLRNAVANPMYYARNPYNLKSIFSDCADLPFILRAYFSWMNDLPFSFPTEMVEAKTLSRNKKDIRYSKFGNIVISKNYVRNGDNINNVLQSVSDIISTASFRTNASKNDTGVLFRDTYPVDIDRKSIVAGTVVYDPNGHVAIVYNITSNGKIDLIDAHPDNSLTAITYGEKFARTSVKIGGGFSNFRPFSVAGNRIEAKKNDELSGFSLIQFQSGPFVYKGQEYSFHDYVRRRLADGDVVYDPISEFTNFMEELCQDIKYREDAVNISLESNIQNQSHPKLLPANIYGADGDWESFSTPARDARIKTSVREGKEFLTKVIAGYLNHSSNIKYRGTDLVSELREIYLNKSKTCVIKVTPTSSHYLELSDILINLFALSFDPYHCAELRWGIIESKNCNFNQNKLDWYNAEQGLRNRLDRDNTIKTDYDVDTLPSAPASNVKKPDLSYDKLLEIKR